MTHAHAMLFAHALSGAAFVILAVWLAYALTARRALRREVDALTTDVRWYRRDRLTHAGDRISSRLAGLMDGKRIERDRAAAILTAYRDGMRARIADATDTQGEKECRIGAAVLAAALDALTRGDR